MQNNNTPDLVQAYKQVIADLTDAIGFVEADKTTALAVINQRLWELEVIWAIPTDEWNKENN